MAKQAQVRVKGVYGKPISKAAGNPIQLTSTQVKKAAAIILKVLKREIKKDMTKASTRGAGQPVPIPNSRKFLASWKVRVSGRSTIEITSNWPTAKAHTVEKQSGPYNMKWLMQPKVPYARMVQKDGVVVVRTTPPQSGTAWIHPGFKKYGFIERGVRLGKIEAIKALSLELIQKALDEEVDVG